MFENLESENMNTTAFMSKRRSLSMFYSAKISNKIEDELCSCYQILSLYTLHYLIFMIITS